MGFVQQKLYMRMLTVDWRQKFAEEHHPERLQALTSLVPLKSADQSLDAVREMVERIKSDANDYCKFSEYEKVRAS